jgi:hypothetical protein
MARPLRLSATLMRSITELRDIMERDELLNSSSATVKLLKELCDLYLG